MKARKERTKEGLIAHIYYLHLHMTIQAISEKDVAFILNSVFLSPFQNHP